MAQKRPNIVILMADQLGASALGAYGHKLVKTPNIDTLVQRGAVFDNFYSSFPLCAPARLALMTGRLCSNIQAWDNAAQIPSDIPTFAHYLRVLGYRTCLSGKMHFIGPDQLHGFEERVTTDICPSDFNWTADWDDPWRTMDWFHDMKNVSNAGIAERALQQDYDEDVAHNARRWIFDWARDPHPRPFMLVASFTHPHDPYVTPKKFWDMYRHEDIDMPRVPFIPPDKRDPHSRRLWEQYDRGEFGVGDDHVRNARHAYYGSVSYLDERVGEVLEALTRAKLMEDTIVLFLADHGDMLGERGLWYKMSLYDWSARVPLIMAGPGVPKTRIKSNAGLVDILPTLVDLANDGSFEGYPDAPDGQSLVPLFRDDAGDRIAVSELMSEGVAAPYVLLRKGRYKLTYVDHDPPQLFDMEADRDELHDLADDPAHAEVLEDMLAEVHRRWDMPRLTKEIMSSQRRRRLVYKALTTGKITPWDYQPWSDASLQYYRGTKSYHEAEARDLLEP